MKLVLNQSLLLDGRRGLSMLADAEEAAREYLSIKKLEKHPDFLMIGISENKKSIGVDDLGEFMEKAYLRPAIAQKQVFIIDGIDLFTVAAQNKILKVLEDCQNVIVLAIAYSGGVLATIRSRLVPVKYLPLSFESYLREGGDTPENRILFYLTNGCPGMKQEMEPYVSAFLSVAKAVAEKAPEELLRIFHLIREKDKESIALTPYVKNTIMFLKAALMQEMLLLEGKEADMPLLGTQKEDCPYDRASLCAAIKILTDNEEKCSLTVYSKDNLFQMFVKLIAVLK